MGTILSATGSARVKTGRSPGNLAPARPALAGLVACLACAGGFGQATFQGLGDLPGAYEGSAAFGMAGNGTAVVGIGDCLFVPGSEGSQAFRWTAGEGTRGLGYVTGFTANSIAQACSQTGDVIVGGSVSASGASQAFLWTAGDGMIGLGDLPGGQVNSTALATSASGAVIVGQGLAASGSQAFRWSTSSGMVGLGHLPGGSSFRDGAATGVSGDGAVIVGYDSSDVRTEAFRWTSAGGMVGLGDLPGGKMASLANAISADGRIIVGTGAPGGDASEAVRWDEAGVPHGLGDLPGGGKVWSSAFDVSTDGSIVVGRGRSDFGDEAFIWDAEHGMRSLQSVLVNDFGLKLDGWQLLFATAVSDDGRTIAGFGANPSGGIEGWVATIPEPGTALLVLAALALRGMAGRIRRPTPRRCGL